MMHELRLMGLLIVAALTTAFMAANANAHEARPLYVEITEHSPSAYTIRQQVPPTVPAFNLPQIVLPKDCTRVDNIWRCDTPLDGRNIAIEYPRFNPSVSTLVRFHLYGGEKHTILGNPDEAVLSLPGRDSVTQIAGQYMRLGVDHIFAGYDHLLFVICLLFIAGTGRRILVVITGFTLAHSVTLAAATLDLIRLPAAPIEALIALSVAFLATEIARAQRSADYRNTLTWRHPIAVSASFGLLHGFGFASVLRDIGLPQTETAAALLFFNLGIELGQLLFILAILAVGFVVRWIPMAPSRDQIALPASYFVGIIASYWLIERVINIV
ncbi:MAG: HupE/UreJ family protein [Alphaproteobacteria bacterium]|nr:MAG: HupE/UreJ family protein [Alphaproteobacteria bacterium]